MQAMLGNYRRNRGQDTFIYLRLLNFMKGGPYATSNMYLIARVFTSSDLEGVSAQLAFTLKRTISFT